MAGRKAKWGPRGRRAKRGARGVRDREDAAVLEVRNINRVLFSRGSGQSTTSFGY